MTTNKTPNRTPYVLALCAALFSVDASAEVYRGKASILDGNTIKIGDMTIDLGGMDTFDVGQACLDASGRQYPCGQQVTDFLQSMIGDKEIECDSRRTITRTHVSAKCGLNGMDIAQEIIRQGLGLSSIEVYDDAENEARNNNNGVWSGRFTTPAIYRANRQNRFDRGNGSHKKKAQQDEPETLLETVVDGVIDAVSEEDQGDTKNHIHGKPEHASGPPQSLFPPPPKQDTPHKGPKNGKIPSGKGKGPKK